MIPLSCVLKILAYFDSLYLWLHWQFISTHPSIDRNYNLFFHCNDVAGLKESFYRDQVVRNVFVYSTNSRKPHD